MADIRIFRIAIPVNDIERAADFYSALLDDAGERVWVNRHYFRCGETILACVAPPEAVTGDEQRIIYFTVDELDAVFARAARAEPSRIDDAVIEQAWGERSFYVDDPFGNKLCFVQSDTVFTGR